MTQATATANDYWTAWFIGFLWGAVTCTGAAWAAMTYLELLP